MNRDGIVDDDQSADDENDAIDDILDLPALESRNYTNNSYIGTVITEEKSNDTTRILGCNPNGIKLKHSGEEYNEFLEEVKRLQADVTCLYEINLDTHKPKVKHHNKSLTDRNYHLQAAQLLRITHSSQVGLCYFPKAI
jgi:hypothetical protein